MLALVSDEISLTYKELDRLIDQYEVAPLPFYAYPTLDTVIRILAHFKKGVSLCPISPREPKLPSLSLPQENATYLATSGTTLHPKIAINTFDAHIYAASHQLPELTLQENDVYELSLPLNHVGGLTILLRCYLAKACILLSKNKQDLVTHTSLVTTQLKRLLKEKKKYPRLKSLLLGGGPLSFDLCLAASNQGYPIYLTYGMTEMASQIATRKFSSQDGIVFGFPLEGREIHIENNEIYVKGKTLFKGYLQQSSPFLNGYFPTKDLGAITEKGVTLLGRKDRMIISGGENIHLEEIELASLSHPDIIHAKASSRDDDEYGKRPLLSLYVSKIFSSEQIRQYLKEKLPSFKVPSIEDITITLESRMDEGKLSLKESL